MKYILSYKNQKKKVSQKEFEDIVNEWIDGECLSAIEFNDNEITAITYDNLAWFNTFQSNKEFEELVDKYKSFMKKFNMDFKLVSDLLEDKIIEDKN